MNRGDRDARSILRFGNDDVAGFVEGKTHDVEPAGDIGDRSRCVHRDHGRTGILEPSGPIATSTTSASVTLTRSPCPAPQRSASTTTLTVMEVCPTRTVSVKKLTRSPTKT